MKNNVFFVDPETKAKSIDVRMTNDAVLFLRGAVNKALEGKYAGTGDDAREMELANQLKSDLNKIKDVLNPS